MSYPDNLLARGERVVLRTHPHWKTLIPAFLWFLVIVGGGSALIAWSRSWKDSGFTSHTQWLIGIIAVGVILLIWLVVVPIVRWKTEHFVLSTGHVFFRSGLLSRREHQIPLARIQNLEVNVSFWGRLLGFGSLIVESAADQPLEFLNIARLSKVQTILNQLIADDRSHGQGDYDGRQGPPQYQPQYQPQQQEGGTAQYTQAYPTEQASYPPPPADYPQGPPSQGWQPGRPPNDRNSGGL
jgi:membrane protein YdbS with pleckstrin-like domain